MLWVRTFSVLYDHGVFIDIMAKGTLLRECIPYHVAEWLKVLNIAAEFRMDA